MESTLVKIIEEFIRKVITFSFQWISEDGEVLGYILAIIHVMGTIAIGMCVILSHTLYPVLWFQIFSFVFLFSVLIQHVFLKVCVISVAEQMFTSSLPPSHVLLNYLYASLFGNTCVEPLSMIVFGETILVSALGLELIAKFAEYVYKINQVSLS